MKRLLLIFALLCASSVSGAELLYDYVFFDNSQTQTNYYYTETTYQTPSWILNSNKRLPVEENIAFTPGNSLELSYISSPKGNWTAEIQHRPVRGNDFFNKSEVLSMRLYMKEVVDAKVLPLVAIRFKGGKFTPFVSLGDFVKSPEAKVWSVATLPLSAFGMEAVTDKNINTIAAVVFKQNGSCDNVQTLYLDQVELLPTSLPRAASAVAPLFTSAKGYEQHVDLTWNAPNIEGIKYFKIYRSFDNKKFEAIGIQRPFTKRYADFIGETNKQAYYKVATVDYSYNESPLSKVITAKTSGIMSDDQLLDMVQEAQMRYYWEGAEPESGLALENIPGRHDMIATGASGFGIMSLIVGMERGWINREEGVKRFQKITSFLEKTEKFHGAVSHFINGKSAATEPFFGDLDDGGDLVETSFLFQGLLVAQQYFSGKTAEEKQIRESIDKLWKGIEWDWYKRYPDNKYLFWHWSKDHEWAINHQLIGWNETMITYLLAIFSPTHGVDASMYYSGWASQEKVAQDYRADWGQTKEGNKYTNGNTYYGIKLDVGVSTGGPLFFIHYSYMGLDPHKFTDRYVNYYENNKKMAEISYRYCVENPGQYKEYGPEAWGLTASDYAWNYQAQEAVPHQDNGTVAPTGALASFPYTPEESMAALKNYYRNYGKWLWGEYGFRDAFNPTDNWCAEIFMGLNQAPVTVMIENYRTGLIWNLFMSHPDVQSGLQKMEAAKKRN